MKNKQLEYFEFIQRHCDFQFFSNTKGKTHILMCNKNNDVYYLRLPALILAKFYYSFIIISIGF